MKMSRDKREGFELFSGGENEWRFVDNIQASRDRFAAFSAIERRSAMALHTGRGSRAAARSAVDSFRIDIVADAMDHTHFILQLRMIVNANASLSQLEFPGAYLLCYPQEMAVRVSWKN